MNELFKYIVAKTYKPLLLKYLSGTRSYSYKGIILKIPSEVFHPAFFSSTKLLLRYLSGMQLGNRRFLELGAGSGLISLVACKRGALVTATDINPVAVKYLKWNADHNGALLNIIHSDMFESIPFQAFDLIAINPPYYKKQPVSNREYAWYCGENGEYFSKLFSGLQHFMHQHSQVLMVLSENCDKALIKSIAAKNGFRMHCVHMKKSLIEMHFIYKIEIA